MLERCPTCGKTIGTLMESDPDKPGLTRSSRAKPTRVLGSLSPSPCACRSCSQPSPPRLCRASAAGVWVDRYLLLWADSATQPCQEILTRLIFA
jgi:hypothetical protein